MSILWNDTKRFLNEKHTTIEFYLFPTQQSNILVLFHAVFQMLILTILLF